MTVLVNEDFASDAGGFSAGSQVDAEGAVFDDGYLSLPADSTAEKTFTEVAQSGGGTLRCSYWVKVDDEHIQADGLADIFIYLLPTSGSVASSNSAATITIRRDSSGEFFPAATTNRVFLTASTSGAQVDVMELSRGSWFKLTIDLHLATRTFDVLINDTLFQRALSSGNASFADVSRLAFLNRTNSPGLLVDKVRIESDYTAPAEAVLITDDFTVGSGDVADSQPTTNAVTIHPQNWVVPRNADMASFTRSADGLVPSATKNSAAYVTCQADGTFDATFKASAQSGTDQTYGSIMFRAWEGLGLGLRTETAFWLLRYRTGVSHALILSQGSGTQKSSASLAGLTIDASDEYGLRVVVRGRYIWCYARNITDAGDWQLQFGGPHLINSDATGGRGLLGEQQAGPFIFGSASNVGADNFVTGFTYTGRESNHREAIDLGTYEAEVERAFVGELYLSNAGTGEQDITWGKGLQFSHRGEHEPAMSRTIEHAKQINGTNVKAYRQRSLLISERKSRGWSDLYLTFTRRGVWADEANRVHELDHSAQNPDHDWNPRFFDAQNYVYCGNSGSSSTAAHTPDHSFRDDFVGALPHGFQVRSEYDSGNPGRLSCVIGNIQNRTGANSKLKHEAVRDGAHGLHNIAGMWEGGDATNNTTYQIYRAYLLESGSGLALDGTLLTDWRDDLASPASFTFTTGSSKADASGDGNADGFNERHGWYEVTAVNDVLDLANDSVKRIKPVFRVHGLSDSDVTVTKGETVLSLNADYWIDDLGDGSHLLQLNGDLAASETLEVSAASAGSGSVGVFGSYIFGGLARR